MKRFPAEIGWDNWGILMCDRELFAPLVGDVLKKCGLPDAPVSAGFPGTHAVFLAGEAVIKLYAPLNLPDGEVECAAYRAAAAANVPHIPTLLGEGEVESEGRVWSFLTLSRIAGTPTRECWRRLTGNERACVGRAVGEWMRGYHTLPDPLPPTHALGRDHWSAEYDRLTYKNAQALRAAGWPEAVVLALLSGAAPLREEAPVWVHADLTEDHLLVEGDSLSIIDLADSRMAPAAYEWPALYFGGLAGDVQALSACAAAAGLPSPPGPDAIAASAITHLFGAPILLRSLGGRVPADADELFLYISRIGNQ